MNSLPSRLTLLLLAAMAPIVVADEGTEPPVVYTLEIDGVSHILTPDEPLTLKGEFRNPKVTLQVARIRKLQAAGITFNYPSHFTYEADTSDPDVQTWTASGNSVTLILFNFSEMVDPRALAQSTAEALEAADPKFEPMKLKLGDRERAGVKATMKLAGQMLIQQTLALPPTPQGSRLLVVQEVRSEGEAAAAELGQALQLLSSSLQVQP